MADLKISELSAAGALTGAESVEVVQSGSNVKTTTQDIANLASAGSGHVIEDEGTPLTQRANMNFTGAGVAVTDAGGKTVVTIPSASAILASSISDGDTTHAPDGNSVFDALTGKLDSLVSLLTFTASHTLDATDLAAVNAGDQLVIRMNSASATDLEIPLNATQAFPVGTVIGIRNINTGVVNITAVGGVTLQAPLGALDLANQYDMAYIEKVATDTWVANGQLTA